MRSRDVLRRAGRGAVAAFALLGLVVGGGFVSAAPAQAGLYNLFPADFDGFPKGHFYSDEALYVTLTSDIQGGVVCIVPAELSDPGLADCVSDLAWGNEHDYVGLGTLLGFPLAAPPLLPGSWRLLTVPELWVEETVPVVKNSVTDQMKYTRPGKGTELSEVFVVEHCAELCDTSWAEEELQSWKDMAAKFVQDPEREKAKKALAQLKAAHKIAGGMYAGASGGLAGVLLGGLAAGGVFQFAIDIPSTEDIAKKIYTDLTTRTQSMYAGIAADPPDFDYDQAVTPVFPEVPDTDVPLLDDFYRAMADAAAYGDASRIANERYQGAVIDGDHEAAYLQAQATADFTRKFASSLRMLELLQSQVAAYDLTSTGLAFTPAENALGSQPYFYDDVDSDEPDGSDVTELWNEALADLEDMAANGLTQEQRDALKDCDATDVGHPGECLIDDALIDAALAQAQEPGFLTGLQAIDPQETIGEHLTAEHAFYADAIAQLNRFATWMTYNAMDEYRQTGAGAPNSAPVSSFTASAIAGEAPLTVEFTSTATDADEDALSLRWDIAGTRIVEGETTITHTFTEPGNYGVSLVADDGEEWHQAVKWIEVRPPGWSDGDNRAPIALFTPTIVDGPGPVTQTFTSRSSDPDGDELTHTWYFGDGSTATGESVTKTFPPGFVMSVLLVVSDGQLSSQASGEVASRCSDCAPNAPPVPSFTLSPETGTAPLDIEVTATSTDADGDELVHTWHFGDGTTATGDTATHRYDHPGHYTITLVAHDGTASVGTTRTVTVREPAVALQAGFTVGKGYDAASAFNGAAILDTGVSQASGYPVTNLSLPSGQWITPNGVTDEQTIIVRLAGGGHDLLDRVRLTAGVADTSAVKSFSIALTDAGSPYGDYDTVVDHAELARFAEAQAFSFPARTATFLKLTVHDNHGGPSIRLGGLAALTVDRDGGVVSLDGGTPATATASSEYSAVYSADKVLHPDGYWSTPLSTVADQSLRIRLGGEGPHLIDRVMLRGSDHARSLKDFEIWTSSTGAEGSFTKVSEGTVPRDGDLHTFSFDPVSAAFVELRMADNHGDAHYLYLYEMRVLSTHGLNLADGDGVGAQVVDVSGNLPGYLPGNVLNHTASGTGWIGEAGAVFDQHLTVLLRNGDTHLVDRVVISPGGYRPKNVEVQVSDDGETFATVATRQLFDTSLDQTIAFEPTEARFVRLMLRDGYHTTYLGVQRMRVFTTDRGGASDVPFADVSAGTPVSWAWDFGDGGTSTEQHPRHTFPGSGTYPITLTVTDADGGSNTVSGSYTVPGMPSVSLDSASYTADEGAWVTLSAVGTGVQEWEWDLGHPSSPGTTGTQSTRFPGDGEYTVSVRGLTADWLWTPPVARQFTVLNVAPYVNAGSPVSGLALDPLTPSAAVSDPVDALTCTWDWGDGTEPEVIEACTTGNVRVPHSYAIPGTYPATLTADDGDGGVTSETTEITVRHRPSFIQVTDAAVEGDDLRVAVKLLDGPRGTGLEAQPLEISAGGVTRSAQTGSEGSMTVTLPGAAGADVFHVEFAGSAVHSPSGLTRPVKVPKADIVFLIDESGSMSGYQQRVKAHIQEILEGLGEGLDYRVGLVGYASGDHGQVGGYLHSALTDDLSTYIPAVNALASTGGSANGYAAALFGSSEALGFTPAAASCAVLVSDAGAGEVADALGYHGVDVNRQQAVDALAERRTTFFAIVPPDTNGLYGTGSTDDGPGLAAATGGNAWTLTSFLHDPSEVLSALVDKCATAASIPDLAVTIDAAETASGTDPFDVTVTASNEAAVETPGVTITVTVPEGLTADAISDGGVFAPDTRIVTWQIGALDAGADVSRTVTMLADDTGLTPGDHPFELVANIDYDGSLGAESSLTNNEAAHTVTVQVPHSHDVGVTVDTPTVSATGDQVSYTLTASNHGTATATGVSILQRVPDRMEITGVDLPAGWTNANGTDLAGPHPDGTTDGVWLHLTADELVDTATIPVTASLRPLDAPLVIEDDGPLDADVPDLAAVVADALDIVACVDADQDAQADNDCVTGQVPLRDIAAAVTVRLSGGITYLIVSVDTTAALAGEDVTLTWTPTTAGAEPADLVITDLAPGVHHVIEWPGATFTADGVVTGWPGWRPLIDADTDADGAVLHPGTGEPMTEQERTDMLRGEMILDPTLPSAAWRGPSQLGFHIGQDADTGPSLSLPVSYREVVPNDDADGETDGETDGEDGEEGGRPQREDDASGALPTTGADPAATRVLLSTGLLGLLIGTLILWASRRRRQESPEPR